MLKFQGLSHLSLDAKGRLSVPTKHRDVLMANAQGELTITRHPHGCLIIYPRPVWVPLCDHLANLGMKKDKLKRLLMGNAADVEMDGAGRILIAPELRAIAKIERDVSLVGMGDHFELWDKAMHETQQAQDLENGLEAEMQDIAL